MRAQLIERIILIPLVCLLAAQLAGCKPAASGTPPGSVPRPPIDAENFPRLDGSTSAEPIIAEVVCEFLDLSCDWMEWPLDSSRQWVPDLTSENLNFPGYQVSGTHSAYTRLIDGEVDLIIVARKPSADEWVQAAMKNVELTIEPVALDGFVFIVNDQNPVENLTTDQIRKIYTGKLKDWAQVGGSKSEIHPYQRDENSGSQELMLSLLMRGIPMPDVPELTLPTMNAPFYAVSQDVQGLSYSVYYFEEFLAPAAEKVKLIAVDGVMPGPLTIASSEYPYTTEVYAVILGSETQSTSRLLFDWLGSPDGQGLIKKVGYTPRY